MALAGPDLEDCGGAFHPKKPDTLGLRRGVVSSFGRLVVNCTPPGPVHFTRTMPSGSLTVVLMLPSGCLSWRTWIGPLGVG